MSSAIAAKKEEGIRKARYGFGRGYTDELLNLHYRQKGILNQELKEVGRQISRL
ncbi:MAG: hypothetical protein ACRC62_25055 [Microcoleus sp.]